MKKIIAILASSLAVFSLLAETEPQVVKVSATPMHDGKATTLLYGNFIELLDDLVPGMRAEMFNNRGFEGITKPVNWAYYDGAPNICDQDWQMSGAEVGPFEPFNGAQCVKMTMGTRRGASLTQTNLSVELNENYAFTGYFRAENTNLEATIILKSQLPTGEWWELGRARLPGIPGKWKKLSGTIRANGTSDRAVFELRVTGFGTAYADQLSLMPDSNRAGWRFDVIEAIKEVHPAVIRWGGSVIDPGGYKWKDGIGDRDKRLGFPNKIWGRTDPNEVGIDEFCQLCRVVQCRPMICLSFADGAASAEEMVAYCNDEMETPSGMKRKLNGYARAYRVLYWQVGNEISGDDENYLKQISDFSQRIKRADRKAQVLASFPTQKLLTTAGKDLDYVCPHQYTADLATCESEFNKLGQMIHNTPDCSHLKVAVTEWNTSAGNWGLERGKFLTLGGALQNARYLNLLLRHSDIVEIACRSNLANSLGSGIFETSNSGILKRPSFFVMKMYNNHTTVSRQILKLENAPKDVDMVATKLENARNLATVFAVNSRSEPVTIKLDLSELGTDFHINNAEVVCDSQDAHQPDVMNHWNAPGRVGLKPLAAQEDDKITLPALSAAVIECHTVH